MTRMPDSWVLSSHRRRRLLLLSIQLEILTMFGAAAISTTGTVVSAFPVYRPDRLAPGCPVQTRTSDFYGGVDPAACTCVARFCSYIRRSAAFQAIARPVSGRRRATPIEALTPWSRNEVRVRSTSASTPSG